MRDIIIYALWCITPFTVWYIYRSRSIIWYVLWVHSLARWYFTRKLNDDCEYVVVSGKDLAWRFSFLWNFKRRFKDWIIFVDWFSLNVPLYDDGWTREFLFDLEYEYRLYTVWYQMYVLKRYPR